jgi:hypothetical protein
LLLLLLVVVSLTVQALLLPAVLLLQQMVLVVGCKWFAAAMAGRALLGQQPEQAAQQWQVGQVGGRQA